MDEQELEIRYPESYPDERLIKEATLHEDPKEFGFVQQMGAFAI